MRIFGQKTPVVELKLEDEFLEIVHEGQIKLRIEKDQYGIVILEVERWYKFLNVSVGAASLAFAQTAQGTPHPPLNAGIGIFWLSILFLALKDQHFPSYLSELRQKKDPIIKQVRRLLEGKFLGTWAILTKMPFFWLGYLYLLFVVFLWLPSFQNISVFDTSLGKIFLPASCTCYAAK